MPPPASPSPAPESATGPDAGRGACLWAGVRAILPILPGIVPFALVAAYGAKEAGLSLAGALGLSTIVFAGAAQIAFVSLLATGAVAPVILATVLVINLRMVMYSASLAPHLRDAPWWARGLMSYIVTDQAYAVSITRFSDAPRMRHKAWFYMGTAAPLWIIWQVFTVAGMLAGAEVPPEWGLEFTVPLVFLVLLVPAMRDRPSIEAAVVGGGVAVMLAGLPFNLGLMIGGLSGIVWGVLAEDRQTRRQRRARARPGDRAAEQEADR
ncbi:AzlC family ABC transporter permease [Roseospira navarrensis]|uniref:Branched-chain amino acid ABC transporter permease n=1 Tax=Roseospira navarrensis TaxID=140058 RepID=A0A7X1ZDK9_9PROT|nr:AzlC family ABC transporter permease [Roseospira navarrensis]MQX36094.1 branched-chain amino acid ABC transporter permease [Roseospira navarrensis]